jgi:hypothetical protein
VKEDDPELERPLQRVDDLKDVVEISDLSESQICLRMVANDHVQGDVRTPWSGNNPLAWHRVSIERDDGKVLDRPSLTDLKNDRVAYRVTAQRYLPVGETTFRDSQGGFAGTAQRFEWVSHPESLEIERHSGKACFATSAPFVDAQTRSLKLMLKALLYADVFTFEFD